MQLNKKISILSAVFCLSFLGSSYVQAEESKIYTQQETQVGHSGWLESNGIWSYTNISGMKQIGWLDLNNTWYYFNENGIMQTGWLELNDTWYYLNENGAMQTGWLDLDGTWYRLDANGILQTGWLNLNNAWYYLDNNGVLQTGWHNIARVGYYFDENGIMATNTIVEGWKIDGNGVANPILSKGSYPEYQKEILELVNAERAKYNVHPLILNAALSNVAMLKSEDMVDRNYFSHYSPTYGSPFEMMDLFGIKYWTAGENISMGQRTPQSVMSAWMNSSGHRANILDKYVTEIGIGIAVDSNNGRYYWTQMFVGNQFYYE